MHVGIFGGGGTVGSTVAASLAALDDSLDLTLVDVDSDAAHGHAIEVAQTWSHAGHPVGRAVQGDPTGPPGSADACHPDDLPAEPFDLVVVTASGSRPPESVGRGGRKEFLDVNRPVVREVAAALDDHPEVPVVVVTNPMDRMLHELWRALGWQRSRLVGYALSETARANAKIAELRDLDPRRVHCPTIGEHGEHVVPLFSRATAAGDPVDLSPDEREEVREFVRNSAYTVIDLRGAEHSSRWLTGHGVALLVECILTGGVDDPVCLSTPLDGEYGCSGVSLSVPVRLDEGGIAEVVEWDLTDEERERFEDAAAAVREDLE